MIDETRATAVAHVSSTATKQRAEYGEIFRLMFEQSGLCMATLDRSLCLREANIDFLAQFGRNLQDSYGRPFSAFLHPTVRRSIGRDLELLSAGERDRVGGKFIAVRQDGALLFGELIAVSVVRSLGEVDSILVLVGRTSRVGEAQAMVQRGMLLVPMDAKILEGVAAGMSTGKLATVLHMSRGGVEYRITALLRRFKAVNRTELASKAYSMGLLTTDSWPPTVQSAYVQA
ncbi:LuxR C-terminal-related transcriptional regulator [Streptomyces cyanogenus]|uniref:Bacterial regulatory protein, LuxR family n=1 Tax=Streptomyces cyanogenus TaxID=80860 RepID=A0A896WL80_STRCY|nr:LuxR C-terminal-related transcriptional regulator [Streptomyces cyanogenus]QSE03596.1 LcmRII [Streptomyces cyanogenus]QTE02443.1 Bacterial regulatory protein, LuxR family [Streptomyces cyanogenus]